MNKVLLGHQIVARSIQITHKWLFPAPLRLFGKPKWDHMGLVRSGAVQGRQPLYPTTPAKASRKSDQVPKLMPEQHHRGPKQVPGSAFGPICVPEIGRSSRGERKKQRGFLTGDRASFSTNCHLHQAL